MVEASGERAVGLGGNARNVATGDYATQIDTQIDRATVLPAEAFRPVEELTERLVRLPVRTRLFVGRERELQDSVRRHGEDHPATLNARNNLAGAYQASGNLERAIELLLRNVADRERILGPDHPQTSLSLNNLGGAYLRAGRTSEAISVYEQALEGYGRSLGEDHPNTRRVRDNLDDAREASRRETTPPE